MMGYELRGLAKLVELTEQGEQLEIYAKRWKSNHIRLYKGEIEILKSSDSFGVGIRSVSNHRVGFAHSNSLFQPNLMRALDKARQVRELMNENIHFELQKSPDLGSDLELASKSFYDASTDEKIELVKVLEADALREKDVSFVEHVDYQDVHTSELIANSLGTARYQEKTSSVVSLACVAEDGKDAEIGYGSTFGRSLDDLRLDQARKEAVFRSVKMLGAKKPKSEVLPVIFDPTVTSSFLSLLVSPMSAKQVFRKSSFFENRQGELVASKELSLEENPLDLKALNATNFDGEGLPAKSTLLIDRGRLIAFLSDSEFAKRLNLNSTNSAIRPNYTTTPIISAFNLLIHPGQFTQRQVFEMPRRAVYVTSVAGIHSGVNVISGDFSVGAEGFMVENGQLRYPIKEFTIASTIQRMLLDVVAVSNDVKYMPSNATGAYLLIDNISVSAS